MKYTTSIDYTTKYTHLERVTKTEKDKEIVLFGIVIG